MLNSFITSNAGSGSSNPTTADNISVTYGSAYGTLPTVSRDGYTFNGWYTEASGGTQVTNTSPVVTAENHMLYARWTANSYTVEFNANGGSGTMSNQSFIYDAAVQSLSTNGFTRDGYIFKEWNTASNGTGASYSDGVSVKNLTNVANGTFTLYAQWEEDPSIAQIGTTKYETLQAAINAVNDNETIILLRNSTESITIPETKSGFILTIDLNGKILDGGENIAILHYRGGKLTIIDSASGGKITSIGDYTIRMDLGILFINGATVENHRTTGGSTLFTYSTGSMHITNATVIKTGKGDAINISSGSTEGGNELNITNSMVSSSDGRALHINATRAKINLTGASISSFQSALRSTGDSVEICISGDTKLASEAIFEDYNYATIELVSAPKLYISGATIENTAEYGNAIYNELYNGASGEIIISGSSIIRGKGKAIDTNTAPTLLSGVGVTASTTYDGNTTVTYDESDISTYKYLKFE